MKIVFTHAYYLFEDGKEAKIMKPYPPLGLLYVSSYMTLQGVENKIFDSTFYSFDEQLAYIESYQPQIVCIYANLMSKINVIQLIKKLKENEKYGFPKIVLGGPDVTYNIENYLKSGAHFLILGEGEETTFELYKALKDGTDLKAVNGLAFIENDQLVKTQARIKMKDLSDLPLPDRESIPMEKYLDIWKKNHGQSSMTISTQRGCPYTCKWCSTAVYGQTYRRRPAKMVVEEMKLLKKRYNPDAIWFVDDVFTVSHKWLREFHQEVLENNIIIPFECITRAERLNEEVLQLLKDIGCFRIWIGAESGSQKIIDAMDRRVDVTQVKEMIQKTNALGIETGTFIMLGYPGETLEDINITTQYLIDANPTHYTITIAYPIKGTSLYQEIEDKITTAPDWETSTDRDIDFKRTYPPKFYYYAVRKVVNEVEYHRKKRSDFKAAFKHKLKAIYADFRILLHQ